MTDNCQRLLRMTGLGPLTTTLIPPPSCASSFTNIYITTDPGGTGGFGGPVGTDRCFPSNYQDIRFYHYSPRICPSGHTTACWTSNVITSLTETTVACCLDFGLLYFYAPTYTGPPVTWKNTYRGCASASVASLLTQLGLLVETLLHSPTTTVVTLTPLACSQIPAF
jgi:hypothetical protein